VCILKEELQADLDGLYNIFVGDATTSKQWSEGSQELVLSTTFLSNRGKYVLLPFVLKFKLMLNSNPYLVIIKPQVAQAMY
jgi:hypothetical protein